MSAVDAIAEIWLSYQMMMGAFKVTARGISHGAIDLLQGTYFVDSVTDIVMRDFEMCRKAAGDYAILGMWAVFERRVISTLAEESSKMLEKPSSAFNSVLHNKVVDAMEYWRADDVLDLIKALVGADLAGKAKQVKKHRDWIAHKNPRKPSPTKVTPTFTYQVLSEIARHLTSRPSAGEKGN